MAVSAPGVKGYESADQTITAAGLLVLAHGFGVLPRMVTAYLICQTAEQGYSIGDVVLAGLAPGTTSGAAPAMWFDSTNINVRMSSVATGFVGANKTTGAPCTFTNANWKLRVKAIR